MRSFQTVFLIGLFLGMGTDGHTASLFPHQTSFDDENRAVIAKHPESGQIRISKTAKLIEQAKRITYLVTGESKADILKEIQTTPVDNLPYPAAKIKAKMGVTECIWIKQRLKGCSNGNFSSYFNLHLSPLNIGCLQCWQ